MCQSDIETIELADLDAWDSFVADNIDAITDQYGSINNAYQHATQGGLVFGGGAAPAFLVCFKD